MYKTVRVVLAVLFLTVANVPVGTFGCAYAQVNVESTVVAPPQESVEFNHYREPEVYNYQKVYKKVRCPNCGMEHYIQKIRSSRDIEIEAERAEKKSHEKDFLTAIVPRYLSENAEQTAAPATVEIDTTSATGLDSIKKKDLREEKLDNFKKQVESEMISCPYCQFHFHPVYSPSQLEQLFAGDKTEQTELEKSFSSAVNFNISRDLKQFGYDVFDRSQKEKERIEKRKQELEQLEVQDSKKILETLKNEIAFTDEGLMGDSSLDFSEEQANAVAVDADYVIGPGDALVINVWGATQQSFPISVDTEGKIMLPKAGPVYVWGLRFREAEKVIIQRLQEYYSNVQVDVSMGKLRKIRLFVMGEVNKPGAQMLSSQATVLHALFSAGGPTKLGSLRNIQLLQGGKVKQTIDLYDILIKGDKSFNIRLMGDDTIFVPPVGNVVGIAGNVKKPAIYEIGDEINLSELLGFAGGLTPMGSLQKIQVERIQNSERKVVLDIDLTDISDIKEFSKTITLKNGDLVVISPINSVRHNFITVKGNVQVPGDYELKPSMKVSDLIKDARGLRPGTYLSHGEVSRVTSDGQRTVVSFDVAKATAGDTTEDIALAEWDIVFLYSSADVVAPSMAEVFGCVNFPGKYELSRGMKASELVLRAGGLKHNAILDNVEILHFDKTTGPVLYRVDLSKEDGPELVNGDQVFIRENPMITGRKLITIEGEVKYPGTYVIQSGERLSSIIERAGGFTDDAYLEGAVFTRESVRKTQQSMLEHFIKTRMNDILQEETNIMAQQMYRKGGGTITFATENKKEFLRMLAAIEMEGRMIVDLQEAELIRGGNKDILVENGDRLVIGKRPQTVQILGAVNNTTVAMYQDGKGVDYYIAKAGGIRRDGDNKAVYVIKANGETTGRFSRVKDISPGDSIIVPKDIKHKVPRDVLVRDFIEMFARATIGVGVIAALQ